MAYAGGLNMEAVAELKERIDGHAQTAFALNYQIAGDPELSGEEYRACAAYVKICRDRGWPVEENFTNQPTAFRARVRRVEAPVMKAAVLAEYDALPDVGHGCGHSANGAMSLLAALGLSELKDLPVDIDLIGTPDEELRGGKAMMCKQGVFKEYDLALMIHISPDKTEPNEHFLALSCYRIIFHGQAAHGAYDPWHGRNALNAAMLAIHGMDMLRQHVRADTRIGTYIVRGGTASNVVPDLVEIECTLRYTERSYLDEVVRKVMNCVKGAAIATETTYEVLPLGLDFDEMVWNEAATNTAASVLGEMGIPYEIPRTAGGSSDMGNVSRQCPALHLHLAAGNTYYPGHSGEIAAMVADRKIEPVLVRGANIIGRIILKLAADESLRNAVAEEFAATRGENTD